MLRSQDEQIGPVCGDGQDVEKSSLANPIIYMVNAFRYGILGTSDISIAYAYLIVGLFVLGLFTVSLLLLNRGVGIRE